jgi:LexA-binding, inner membrane-associated putative hydrolase
MFLGHFGLGLAGKRAAPTVSLGTLLLAVQFADCLWPLLLLLGLEHVRIAPGATRMTPLDFFDYPVSHSLAALVGWGLAFGALHFAWRRNWRAAGILAAGVVSHWVLDMLVHRPDMPLLPGGPYVGLGLWNSVSATVALELGLYGVGLAVYAATTRARDRTGQYALWGLLLFLLAVWIGAVFGPPPPSERALMLSALGLWLVIPWGYWIDRHRTIRRTP